MINLVFLILSIYSMAQSNNKQSVQKFTRKKSLKLTTLQTQHQKASIKKSQTIFPKTNKWKSQPPQDTQSCAHVLNAS